MRFDANIAASGTISAPFGSFDSLTVSGQPVSTGTGGGGGGTALTVRTTDSNPTVSDVDTIVVTAGTLVDDGSGQVTLDTGGSPVTTKSGTESIVSGTIGRHTRLTTDTLGLWLMDGDLTEQTGNFGPVDDNISYDPASFISGVSLLGGYAASGPTGYTNTSSDAALQITGDITVSALIKSTDHGAFGRMIIGYGVFGDANETTNFQWSLATRGSGELRWYQESGASVGHTYDSSLFLDVDITYHVAAVREGGVVQFYVNGELFDDPSTVLTSPTGGSTAITNINYFSASTGDMTVGSVKIHDRALTDDEIYREYETVQALVILPSDSNIIAASGTFTESLTLGGVPVATVDDLFIPTGTASVVSGTIVRPLGTAHNPIGLWTFDGDLTDSSGNGNTLTEEINSGDIVRIGPYLSGYSFHGNTILVAADDSAFEITGDVTWQAIVIYAADTVVAATKTICGQAGPSGDGDDTENFLYRMAVSSTESLQYFAEGATGTNISFASAEKLNGRARRLQHVAIVRENDDVTIYVDGVRHDSSSSLIPPVGGSATRFRIGGDISSGAGANFFTGVITSVKVNAGALTDDQIRREYESTLATAVIPEEFTTISGAFTQSLTVSGVPVDITGGGGGGAALTVKEADGDPTVANVDTIVVTNGTLTDDGSGQVTISIDGSGGGSGGLGQVAASGTIWMPEIAPAIGTQYDDEFVQGTTVSGVEGIWTAWDPGTNIHTMANDEQGLYMRNSNNSGQWIGMFQDVPADGATGRWVAWTYVSMSAAADLTSGYRKVGIGLFNDAAGAPSTTDFQFLGLTSSPGQDWAIERGEYTSYTDTTPSPADYDKATLNGVHFNGVFLRVIKTNDGIADHSMELAYSFDGVGWKSMTSDDPGFDVAHIGLICVNGAGTTLYRYSSKFFRIDSKFNGASMRVQTMRGNFLDPTGSGVGGGGSASTLQEAYDNGDGIITTTAGKPLSIVGDEYDGQVDFQVTGSGKFTESLQVGSGTVFITGASIETPSLIVDGTPISAGVSTTISGVIHRKLDLTHAPVALYLFEGDSTDSSGNGFDMDTGTAYRRTYLEGGMLGARLNGSQIERSQNDASLTISGDITVQAIATISELDGLTNPIRFLHFAASGETEATNAQWSLGLQGDGLLFWAHEHSGGVDQNYTAEDTTRITAGATYLIAATRTSGVIQFYVNGEKWGAPSSALTAPTGGSTAFIKTGNGTAGSIFACGCAKVIDSALTDDEMYSEYERTWQLAPVASGSGGGSSIDESQVALLSQVFGS